MTGPAGRRGRSSEESVNRERVEKEERGGEEGERVLVALDEDALAGALLGGLDDGVLEVLGDRRHAR